MDRLPKLPAREPLLPGESLESLVRRHALAMGYERVGRITALMRDRGKLPPSLNHLHVGPMMDGLGELFGVSAAKLLQTTVHRFAKQLVLVRPHGSLPVTCDSKTILRFFQRGTSAVCSECLREEPVYGRLIWSFSPLPVCLKHERLLIDRCRYCCRRFSSQRLSFHHCQCGHPLMNASQVQLSVNSMRIFTGMQNALLNDQSPIPAMSTAARFWWLERLASAATRTPSWVAGVRQREGISAAVVDETVSWLAAAEMLVDWPVGFEEFLEVFQTVIKHQKTSTGVGRSFGLLLREAKWLEDMGYCAPAEVLRQYLLRRYTLGHLTAKNCLFQGAAKTQLKVRPWLTQTQAAKFLGVRHGAIADLIQRGFLSGEVRAAGMRGRSVGVVSRDSVSSLRQQFASSVPIPMAATRLGIGRHAVLEMVHRSLLEKSIRTAKGWLIPNGALENWDSLLQRLSIRSRPSINWLTLREATRRFGKSGFTLAVILELVRSDTVGACRSTAPSSLGAILVNQIDLEANQERVQMKHYSKAGYPVHCLARTLIPGRPLKAIVLQKWIAAGLLVARQHGPMRIVSTEEVTRFRATYCLADEACGVLRISRTTLSRWEEAGRITALYCKHRHKGAGASVFVRRDVERLGIENRTADSA